MARPTQTELFAADELRRIRALTTIPFMIIIFVMAILGLHILAALLRGAAVTDFGPLRVPAMFLLTGFVMMFLLTLLQEGDVTSLGPVLRNKNVLLALIIVFIFIVWLSSNDTTNVLLPEIFSLARP